MTRQSLSELWALRDDRTLSAHAKLAYVMLWLRLPDVRPSMQTLADDMGTSLSSAHRGVRELKAAGLVKVTPRVSSEGDPDTNQFELTPPVLVTPPPGQAGMTPPVTGTPKERNVKTAIQGRKNSRGPRRARPALSRADRVTLVRIAVAEIYGEDEDQGLSDRKAAGLWDRLIEDRTPANPVSYLCKIFTETPDLDTHLANIEPDEDDPW